MVKRAAVSLLLIMCALCANGVRAEVVQPDEPVVTKAPAEPRPIPAPLAPATPPTALGSGSLSTSPIVTNDPVPVTPVNPDSSLPPIPPGPTSLNVDEPGFKASVRVVGPAPEKPVETIVPKGPKNFTRPTLWSLPQEEGIDGQPIAAAAPGVEPTAGVSVEEPISPALATAIGRERSGKKSHDVVGIYQDVVKAEPQNAEAIYRLGLAFMKDGQPVEGLASLEEALAQRPSNPKYQCDYGLALLRANQRDKAMIACQSAAVNAPAVARYHSALGDCFLSLTRAQEASESYQRAMNIEPNNADFVYNFGLSQMQLKMFKKAIEVFDEAIRLKPSSPQYFCSRGVALENTKKPREALGCYMQALRIDKNYAHAHYLVARMYSDPDDPTYTSSLEAVEHAQAAVKLTKGKNGEYMMGLARALRVAHNFDEAVAVARKAIQLEPRDEFRKELDGFEKLQTLGSFEFSK